MKKYELLKRYTYLGLLSVNKEYSDIGYIFSLFSELFYTGMVIKTFYSGHCHFKHSKYCHTYFKTIATYIFKLFLQTVLF